MTDDQLDPMGERRRNSAGHYAAVDAAIAARPAEPTHITRVKPVTDGLELTVDDGKGTRIAVQTNGPGRIRIVLDDGTDLAEATIPLGTAGIIANVIREVAGLNPTNAAPITGSR